MRPGNHLFDIEFSRIAVVQRSNPTIDFLPKATQFIEVRMQLARDPLLLGRGQRLYLIESCLE